MAFNFRQEPPAFFRLASYVAAIVLSLGCMGLYAFEGEGGPLKSIQNSFPAVISPFTSAGNTLSNVSGSAAGAIENLNADDETLSAMKETIAQLEQELAQANEYAAEAQRLEELLGLVNTYQLEGTAARVIGRSNEAWSQTIMLDKGESDGIDTGLSVVGSYGVIGQVVSTTSHTATVRLLTDPQSGVAVILQSNRAEGIVRGSLEGLMYLENLDEEVSVEVGDVVVTSGLGGSYWAGLVVGTVVQVEDSAGSSTRRAVVSLNDSTAALEEVFIVGSNLDAADIAALEGDDD